MLQPVGISRMWNDDAKEGQFSKGVVSYNIVRMCKTISKYSVVSFISILMESSLYLSLTKILSLRCTVIGYIRTTSNLSLLLSK